MTLMHDKAPEENTDILSPEKAREWLNDFLQEQQKEEHT